MGHVFNFKQFAVDQQGCAMKINTDGVLLGAMATHTSPVRILDIGTGSGVIALMLAQRFKDAFIEAVEIDAHSAEMARKNAQHAPFNERISVYNNDFKLFETTNPYDLVVSNPPYFVNDLKSAAIRKEIARHASDDFFDMLVSRVAGMLTAGGKFWLVLPPKQADEVIRLGTAAGLYLTDRVGLHSDKDKPVFRQIICLGREYGLVNESDFYIYEALNQHTEAYRNLLKDFFLAF